MTYDRHMSYNRTQFKLDGNCFLCSNRVVRRAAIRVFGAATALAIAVAAQPVATITAPGTVRIGGVTIPGSAASEIPLEIGDVVSTTNSGAIVRFDGRGIVTLGKESGLRIARQGDKTMICLVDGSYHYKLEPNSNLVVCRNDKALATLPEGDVAMGNGKRIPLIAAGGAGGAALLAGAVKKKSKDCPDRDPRGDGHDCGVIK
jgi:hypothetical protein